MIEPLLFSPWIDLALVLFGASVALGFVVARAIPPLSDPDEFDSDWIACLEALANLPALPSGTSPRADQPLRHIRRGSWGTACPPHGGPGPNP